MGVDRPVGTEVLDGLAARPSVLQTLLTGNVFANGVVKVSAYGLDKWLDLDLGAYGSDSDDPNRLVPVALDLLERSRGVRLAPTAVWVVGDTPRGYGLRPGPMSAGGDREVQLHRAVRPGRRHRPDRRPGGGRPAGRGA